MLLCRYAGPTGNFTVHSSMSMPGSSASMGARRRSCARLLRDPCEPTIESQGQHMTIAQAGTKDATGSSARGPAWASTDLREKLDGLAAAADHSYAISVELARLAVEVARITLGRSEEAPTRNDRRFADPAWTSNPVFNRIAQTHLASAAALQRIAEDLGDGASAERARFAVDVLTSAWAPTNFVATNPAAIKRAFDTGGMSLVRGARNYISDLRHNGGMPSMVERDAFEVGRDLAVTPGAVVGRDAMAELLQYSPNTETVYERPV